MSACAHSHASEPGLHGLGLEAALTAAEQRCGDVGERLTAARRRVLELLLSAGQPVKAYDLMAGFGTEGETAKPPTVYRALEFLARTGLAHRIESLNAYMACRLGEERHAAGFLICDCCGATREIQPLAAEEVQDAARASGYVLSAVTVEAHGLCPECAAA
jgi:Fur family zinc uptake transcriptional regulator